MLDHGAEERAIELDPGEVAAEPAHDAGHACQTLGPDDDTAAHTQERRRDSHAASLGRKVGNLALVVQALPVVQPPIVQTIVRSALCRQRYRLSFGAALEEGAVHGLLMAQTG